MNQQEQERRPVGLPGYLEDALDMARGTPGGEAVSALASAIVSGSVTVTKECELGGGWTAKPLPDVADGAVFDSGNKGEVGWQSFAVYADPMGTRVAAVHIDSQSPLTAPELSPLDSPLASLRVRREVKKDDDSDDLFSGAERFMGAQVLNKPRD